MVKYMEVLAAAMLLLLQVGVASGLPQDAGQSQLFFFTMDGCGPCAQMEPEIRRLADAGYPVRVVDARANPAWTNHFSVGSTPTSILVAGNVAVRRQTGIVPAAELAQWFHDHAASSDSRNAPNREQPSTSAQPERNASGPDPVIRQVSNETPARTFASSSAQPSGNIQMATMQATVRLKVEDESGFSYATGTVIHSHGTEAIVLTCGHVFRDCNGREKITADIGWGTNGEPVTVPGRMLDYDAGPKDVAIVVIQPGFEVPSVSVAPAQMVVSPGDEVFSIGCDMGQPPTIRKTRVKSLSNYDGVDKYDIFGRPVEGRSGGGLFSAGGQLVGVCNAAAVDFDEGIYSGLENVWSQLARTNLDRLLSMPPTAQPEPGGSRAQIAQQEARPVPSEAIAVTNVANSTPNSRLISGDSELIAVLRDRVTGEATTWIIAQPTAELTQYLADSSKSTDYSRSGETSSLAALREKMPNLHPQIGQSGPVRRGQSPDPTAFRR